MFPKNMTAANRNWLMDIFGLAVVLVVFYFLWIGSYPVFTPDEGRYPEVAREMVMTGDFVTPRVNGVAFLDKPILYYWLQAVAIKLFGVNEWALRLFPALFGIMGTLMTYACGRYLFDRRTGLLSAVVLATSPLFFAGSHYANLDLEVASLITCTLLSLVCGFQSEGKRRDYFFFATYLFAALAFLTKGLIGVAFPGIIGGAWLLLMHRMSLLKKMHLVLGIVLFLIIVLPWYVMVQRANPAFLHYFFVTQQITRFLSTQEFNNQTPFWFYAPIVLAGFFPWTIFLIQALAQAIRRVYTACEQHSSELFLLLWAGIIFTFFSIPHSKTIGYIFPVFPPLALLTGKFLSNAWENGKQYSIYAGNILFTLLGVTLAGLLILAQNHAWISLTPDFSPYLHTIAGILLAAGLIGAMLIGRKTLLPLFILCVSTSALALLTLTHGATNLNTNTTKPLVAYLKTIAQPQDEVVTYFKYYHDLPLYLGQRVTIVADWNSPKIAQNDNWAREMWIGMSFQNTTDWLIEENNFWQRWNSDKRVFVFLNKNYFEQFKSKAKHYFFLGKYNDIILLSNQVINVALFSTQKSGVAEHPDLA